jgi:hypothetical protein
MRFFVALLLRMTPIFVALLLRMTPINAVSGWNAAKVVRIRKHLYVIQRKRE